MVKGEMLITFAKPDNWSSTKGTEKDEPREPNRNIWRLWRQPARCETGAKIPSRNGNEKERSQKTSGLVKKGYGLVSARSQPYRTQPPASCDTAGFSQIPGRIPF